MYKYIDKQLTKMQKLVSRATVVNEDASYDNTRDDIGKYMRKIAKISKKIAEKCYMDDLCNRLYSRYRLIVLGIKYVGSNSHRCPVNYTRCDMGNATDSTISTIQEGIVNSKYTVTDKMNIGYIKYRISTDRVGRDYNTKISTDCDIDSDTMDIGMRLIESISGHRLTLSEYVYGGKCRNSISDTDVVIYVAYDTICLIEDEEDSVYILYRDCRYIVVDSDGLISHVKIYDHDYNEPVYPMTILEWLR